MNPSRNNPFSMKRRAFTLIEILVGLTLSSFILFASIVFFASFQSEINRPVIQFAGDNYSLAPIINSTSDGVEKTDLFDALDLHVEFTRKVNSADMVAVFGGVNTSSGQPTPPSVLAQSFELQTLSALTFLSPVQLRSSQELATAAVSNLVYESIAAPYVSDASNFTVLTLSGTNTVTSITQVRRIVQSRTGTSTIAPIIFEGKEAVLYETTLISREPGVSTWSRYAYRFWLPLSEDVWSRGVGAQHHWYRYDTSWWDRVEPAGYTLVFPDPYASAVVANDEDGYRPLPKSRFAYFVPVSP